MLNFHWQSRLNVRRQKVAAETWSSLGVGERNIEVKVTPEEGGTPETEISVRGKPNK